MIQSGIRKVVYLDEYRVTGGIELLEKAGITISAHQC
jgi:deoxycytidylate deaminase